MKRPTMLELATDYNLWGEYVDPQAIVKESQFKKVSIEEKVRMIESVFGKEQVKEEEAND